MPRHFKLCVTLIDWSEDVCIPGTWRLYVSARTSQHTEAIGWGVGGGGETHPQHHYGVVVSNILRNMYPMMQSQGLSMH